MAAHASGPRRKVFLLLMLFSSFLLLGCILTQGAAELVSRISPFSEEMTLEEALQVTPEDRRPTVLEEMGAPDTFTIHFQTLEGETVRFESWSYFDFQSRFDFVDGELLWTADLEPLPDGSLFPHYYQPDDFQAGMTVDEVRDQLDGKELLEIDLAEGDISGGLGLVGDQILLGFDQGQLVYVETLALSPDEAGEGINLPGGEEVQAAAEEAVEEDEVTEEVPAEEEPAEEEPAAATPQPAPETGAETSGTAGTLIFQDDFEVEPARATPLFGEEFMTYELSGGRGALTSQYKDGLVPVLYRNLTLGDFVLELEITAVNLADGSSPGVIFRADRGESGLDGYYLLLLDTADHELHFAVFQEGAFVRQESREIPGDRWPGGGLYRLRLEVQGESFRVLLNDFPAASFSDGSIPEPGLVGLCLTSAVPPETVFFDDLTVTAHP